MLVKKTIWQPLVIGVALGLLAGTATATGLSFIVPGTDTDIAIGIFATLFLLAAALGGPLAGAIAPAFFVIIAAFIGPSDMKAILNIPQVFWSNLFALGAIGALVGFGYRWIFERLKMPARLLPWAGIVIAYYVISLPSSIIPQSYLLGDIDLLPAILFSYMTYLPQAIFDIFFTSLVFIALPARYRRPLWIEW